MNVGEMIDKLYNTKAMRQALDKESAELKSEEQRLEAELVGKLGELNIDQARGSAASFSFKKEATPNVADWTQVYEYVSSNNDFALLQKRISVPVWRESLEDGVLIPGTEIFEATKTFLRKV